MKDKMFLYWLHQRLFLVHKEPYQVDYMNKLRSIIISTNSKDITPNIATDLEFKEATKEYQDHSPF